MWHDLQDPEIAAEIQALREDTLRLFVAVSAIAYLAWHFAVSPDQGLAYWKLLPVVATGQVVTYLLLKHWPLLATVCFLTVSVISIMAALWILSSPSPLVLLPVVVLTAVVLLHPVAGLLVSAGSVGTLLLLQQAGPVAWLSGERVGETAVAMLITLVAAWTLGRNMVIAVGWALHSYRTASQNAESARGHRAELARALKERDTAYYRLQRASAALELAWKAADAAERAKTEFVTNISHELRTPLNLIVGFSEMMLMAPESYGVPLPAAYRGDLHAVYRSAQHLLTLTNDVIDLARVGVGRLALFREPARLAHVVGDACDIVREYVTAKGLQLAVELPPDLPELSLDGLRIRQVLLNLLTNAARFTGRGSITISATLHDDCVLVRVSDTGPGIAAEELPRVFEEFHSEGGNPTAHPSGLGGVGLGLPISKRFVELHGGRMGVESMLGSGTTFWFTLPAALDLVAPAGARQHDPRPAIFSRGEGVLVLLGGDAQVVRFFRQHIRGYRIVPAPSLRRAVAAAVEHRAAAILADLDHRDIANGKDLPVPLIRLPFPHGQRVAAALGAAAYLVKPVTRARFAEALALLPHPFQTVLVADDDPRFVQLIVRMLRASTQPPVRDVLIAHTGSEALALMREARPDLVVLDLVMPELNGNDVIQAMAATASLSAVPVIVVSGQDEVDGGVPLGGTISVKKPDGFHTEEMIGAVESLLSVLEPPRRYLDDPTAGGKEGRAARRRANRITV